MGSAAKSFEKVLIAGAGPAGLLLAILLAQHGIPSTILELWNRLDDRLRATQYGVPATRVFRRAGILDDIRSDSITRFPSICWRNARTGERLIGIDLSVVSSEPDRMTVLPLNELLQIMLRHCREKYKDYVTVLFNHKVVNIGQDKNKAWAIVEAGADDEERKTLTFQADYLIGCDGGQSTVRKCLFQRSWPGDTFDHQLFVQNVFYDGFQKYGWDGGNYMIGPDFWGLIAKRGKPRGNQGTLWRVTYGDSKLNLSTDEYMRRREIAFKTMLPGHPDPGQYQVTETSQFRIHNRCADKMREGRILLAADAAHVCNPFGGYGCMAAVLDVGGLAECLIGYYDSKADEDILDLYAKIRREKFVDLIDKRSRKNMDRLRKSDPTLVRETDPFLVLLQSMEGNREKTKEFLMKVSSIEYDFTQHYKV